MGEPFDDGVAKEHVLAILDGPGMTVFTQRVKKDLLKHDMNSGDAVNVLRGGKVATLPKGPHGFRYQATTRMMVVEFSFRGREHGGAGAPRELVIESARRTRG